MTLRRLSTFLTSLAMVAAALLLGLAGTAQAQQTAPAAGCTSIGNGKYNCHVWKTANTWWCTTTQQTDSCDGNPAGILYAGTNYFYCQIWGDRFDYGPYYNHWWAQTDDDSGNRLVWLSDVWISGGDNDGKIPGLPEC